MANPIMANRNRVTALGLALVVAGMVGLAFASVPLYRLFCQVTGFGGTTQVASAGAARPAVLERTIAVRFDANVNGRLNWRFKPEVTQITVRLGDETLAFFQAENLGGKPVTGSATFNVTPQSAGKFFTKTECFCFTGQTLQPGEVARMPVSFFVDPAILDDPDARTLSAITLSYTFFQVDDAEPDRAKDGPPPGQLSYLSQQLGETSHGE